MLSLFDCQSPIRKVRAQTAALVLGATLAAVVIPTASSGQKQPQVLFHRGTGGAMWVSAEAAIDSGELRRELFDEFGISEITAGLEAAAHETALESGELNEESRSPYLPEELCRHSTVVDHAEGPKRDSLEDLQRHAIGIFDGKVVEITQGFLSGLPASILTVEVNEVIRSSPKIAAQPTLWVSYPYAAFAAGGGVFCRSEPRYTYRPRVGDRILLFPRSGPLDDDHRLLVPDPVEVVVEKATGDIHFSDELADDEVFGMADDFSLLRREIVSSAANSDTNAEE